MYKCASSPAASVTARRGSLAASLPASVSFLQQTLIPVLLFLALCLPAWTQAQAQDAAESTQTKTSPLAGILKHRADPGNETFLPVEEAFSVKALRLPTGMAELTFSVAKGYYLYRDRLHLSAADPGTQIGTAELPPGVTHNDEYFGPQQIYPDSFTVHFPIKSGNPAVVKLVYQGCAEAGLCYPPQTQILKLSLLSAGQAELTPLAPSAPSSGLTTWQLLSSGDLQALLQSGNLAAILLGFYASGLLLAFTPCVLPMVPILSGIIVGEGANITTLRSFLLSLAYVLGMAVTYTAAGAASALAGQQAQALFQQPWIIVAFALLFVVLAVSMFGAYELQMPASVQTRFAQLSNRLGRGKMISVALMGALSALVVTACVAPALVAALAVIAQTGRIALGATALFSLSIGMGTPLLLVGASGGKLLPKAGPWMVTVKSLFGVGFLAVAAWMLERILPHWASMALYAAVAASLVWVLWSVGLRGTQRPLWRQATAALTAAYGCALLIGALTGASDPAHPLARTGLGGDAAHGPTLAFQRIKTTDDLDREIRSAADLGLSVMVDFYADWCASCKEMERATFSDPAVAQALTHYRLLQADVTAADSADQSLMHRFAVIGPPTTAFFKADGQERQHFRLAGYVDSAQFRSHLRAFEQAP